MAGSINKVILVGNVGRDPDTRMTQSGTKVVTFSVATSERWKDRNTGEMQERTEWHNVVIFNEHLANVAEQYLKKGAKVYVEGQMATRKWTGQDGQDRYTTEVVLKAFRGDLQMLGTRNSPPPADDAGNYGTASNTSAAPISTPADPELDDEIPF